MHTVCSIPGSCPDVKIKFNDFKGPYKGYSRTTLTKNSTFISISKQVQFTFDNFPLSSRPINKKLESSEIVTRSEAPEAN